MEKGFLKKYFKAVASKRLAPVEADPKKSNQHEFNSNAALLQIFGRDSVKSQFETDFLYVDDENDPVTASGILTWYDARANHPTRSEYRMYFPSNDTMASSAVGDSLFICLKNNGGILCVVARQNSAIESQLYWIFGINPEQSEAFQTNITLAGPGIDIESAARLILDQIGIQYESDVGAQWLPEIHKRFGNELPQTQFFSDFARSTVTDADPEGDPDGALFKWIMREQDLFFAFEKDIVGKRLQQGFVKGNFVDVPGFVEFSLSVLNRRKSRAGKGMENHICKILDVHGIRYSHGAVTENKSKPDFLFPGVQEYLDPKYPAVQLTMLASKSTCKDRWRQILAEADRIDIKHLITLEPAISTEQTAEMKSKKVQLVVPRILHATYKASQRDWLFSVSDFLRLVRDRQKFYEQRKRS